jgi:hypothetical protein
MNRARLCQARCAKRVRACPACPASPADKAAAIAVSSKLAHPKGFAFNNHSRQLFLSLFEAVQTALQMPG